MSRPVLGALCLVVLVAACNSGGDDNPMPIDARPGTEEFPRECNPLAAAGLQGCNVGEKCTWIVIQETPEAVGKIGCVADGTVALGGDCTVGDAGETTGFDNCRAGSLCIHGVCKDNCGFGGGAEEQCAAGQSCTRYADRWSNGDDEPMYGACNLSCNPVTQRLPDDTTCGAGQGCYLLVSNTTSVAVCATAGTLRHGDPIPTPVFANSCLPGHQPRSANPNDQTVECGALCDPRDVFITDPANAEGGNLPTPRPAAQVTNFAAEGGAAPYTCESKGAQLPADPSSGEGCRYWWARESFDDPSPFSNTVGWCFKHAAFQYDSDGNMADDAPFPRCAALSSADKVLPIGNPPHDDAIYFWCKAIPTMLTTSIKHVKASSARHQVRTDRLAP